MGDLPSMVEVETLALRLWRERELAFPPRVRRMTPDNFDRASGAWDRMLDEAGYVLRREPRKEAA